MNSTNFIGFALFTVRWYQDIKVFLGIEFVHSKKSCDVGWTCYLVKCYSCEIHRFDKPPSPLIWMVI